jgi:phasin family protein
MLHRTKNARMVRCNIHQQRANPMFEQFDSKQVVSMTKRFSDTAFKAHGLAVGSFERAVELQLKAFENRVNATVEFFAEAADVRDMDTARALFPKSVALVKDGAEKAYATSQELVGLSVKTVEAIGTLVKGQIESANDSVVKPARKASK